MTADTEIRTAAAYMLALLRDDVVCTTEAGGAIAQMVRTGTGYTLTLDSDDQLDTATLSAWTAAVGKGGMLWTMYRGGTQAACEWA